ncbi:MAG: hypothetical protein JW727_02860 [Candidatus Aenigmarchaeota archaeon]|nr:hypothetical protein [Candidatus Aenigmarchaeota archaeon]
MSGEESSGGSGGDDNVISAEEFRDLESDEKKSESQKGGLFGMFKKTPPPSASVPHVGGGDSEKDPLVEVSMKVERLSSRFEMLEEARKHTDERLFEMAEKIGELRSTVVERDRAFNDIASKFERISDITEGLEPDKIRKDLAKKDQQIEQVKAQVESDSEKIAVSLKKIKDMNDIIDQIKGFKDLVSVADELGKKIKIVEGLKAETEKTAGKFESRLYQFNESLSRLQGSITKVEANDETLKELLRTVDALSLRVEKALSKTDFDSSEKALDSKFSELRFDTESKLQKVLDAFKKVDEVTGEAAYKALNKKIDDFQRDYSQYKKDLEARLLKMPASSKSSAQIAASPDGGYEEDIPDKKLGEGGVFGDTELMLVEKMKKMIEDNNEKHSQHMADLELRILELSKSVYHRIERRVVKESKTTRDAVRNLVASGSEESGFFSKRASIPVQARPDEPILDMSSLVKDIYFYLDSGNYSEAKAGFIKLLSIYERQESSNPFILAKITDLHKRIKQIS